MGTLKVKFKPEIFETIKLDNDFIFKNINDVKNRDISYGINFINCEYFRVRDPNAHDWCYAIIEPLHMSWCFLAKDHVMTYNQFNITIEDDVWEL